MQIQKPVLLVLIFIAIFGNSLDGQTVIRRSGETTKAFVERLKPEKSHLVYNVIKSTAWTTKSEAIICFFQYPEMVEGEAYPVITGVLFWPEGERQYNKIRIATFESDGGAPEIRTVFFDEVYGSPELIILCAWPQRHYDYSGTYYSAYFFKRPKNPKAQFSLDQDKRWNNIFENQCQCTSREGKSEQAPFTSARSIRAEIRQLTTAKPKT